MKLAPLLSFLVFLVGCKSEYPLLTVEPSKKDVAGRYELSYVGFNSTIDSELKSKISHSYIELKDDGTMVLYDFPVVTNTEGNGFVIQRFHIGTISYSIAPLGSTSKSTFYGIYVNNGELPDPLNAPRFRGEGPSLTLSFDYFDGDFVQRMAFTRTRADHSQSAEP